MILVLSQQQNCPKWTFKHQTHPFPGGNTKFIAATSIFILRCEAKSCVQLFLPHGNNVLELPWHISDQCDILCNVGFWACAQHGNYYAINRPSVRKLQELAVWIKINSVVFQPVFRDEQHTERKTKLNCISIFCSMRRKMFDMGDLGSLRRG